MKSKNTRRVAFHTLGCKVNQYDTQAIKEKFIEKGYEISDFDDVAHVYVINTCTVTNLGDKKSRQMIRRANRLNPNAIIAVVGCYAQTASEEIMKIPGVNLVLGTRDRTNIVDLVDRIRTTDKPINEVNDIMRVKEFEEMPISSYGDRTRAVLKIQEGCDRYCSYCIIPYARGPVRSRKLKDVIQQVHRLVDAGFQEFVLTGIHVASYGKDLDRITLMDLIDEINAVEGVQRIRLGSLEPTLLSEEFVNFIKERPKICRHYHLSLQSGSDKTLKRMNRKYTTSQYKGIVDRLRENIPNTAITTDIMVGFPGETHEEFKETMDFVKDIGFSKIHVFKYSPRDGTAAVEYKNQVHEEIKETRSHQLINLGKKMELAYLKTFMGKKELVLFEEKSKRFENYYEGYTDHYIRVSAKGDESLIGTIMPVVLGETKGEIVMGSLI